MPAHKPENDVITLHGETIDLASNAGRELVADCTRAAENLISDDDLRAKWELSPADLENLTRTALIKAIRSEREHRVRSGLAAREAAAGYFIKAPAVLNSIMSDTGASPRHRIEAAREMRATATAGSDAGATGGRGIKKAPVSRGAKSVFPQRSYHQLAGTARMIDHDGRTLVAVAAFGATAAFNYARSGLVDWRLAVIFIPCPANQLTQLMSGPTAGREGGC